MLPSDFVSKACVVADKTCKLSAKCAECQKEIVALGGIDKMFVKVFENISLPKIYGTPARTL